MKTNKTKITVSLLLLSICVNTFVTYGFESDKPINIDCQTTTSISNSYSQRVTKTIKLEDRAVKVNSINVNNGRVVSFNFDNNTKIVTFTVDDGSPNQLYNPKKYSKTATADRSSTSTNFPSSIFYDKDGYSGTLYKDGKYYKNNSLTIPASSKQISGYDSETINFEIYKNDAYDDKTESKMATNAKYAVMAKYGWSSLDSVYYNSGGYSGTLYADITAKAVGMVDVDKYPTLENGKWRGRIAVTRSYSGTVTKPETTWYTQDYSGTVYKAGYDDVYSYNITVNYETRPLPPNKPVISSPPNISKLYFYNEVIDVAWSYSDPEDYPLISTKITFKNQLTKEEINYIVSGNKTSHKIPATFPKGAYDITVTVKNSRNMTTKSDAVEIRRNVYKKPGRVITKTIKIDSKFKHVLVITKHELEKIKVANKVLTSSIQGYILLPKYNSNGEAVYDINTTDPNYRVSFTLQSNLNQLNDVVILPRTTNEIKIMFILDSEDKEYSFITPILDHVTVYAK